MPRRFFCLTASMISDKITLVLRNQGVAIIDIGAIAAGNQRILIRCATHRGRRFLPHQQGVSFFSPLSSAERGWRIWLHTQIYLFFVP